MIKTFIDGQSGTTGLQIAQRLKEIPNIEIIQIENSQRKNVVAKFDILKNVDVAILCLQDDDAITSIDLIDSMPIYQQPRIIDASSAHRVHPNWIYGFAELTCTQEQAIANANRVSNPGCYATGAIALIRPLIDNDIIKPDTPLSLNAVSGYSGGGNRMIKSHELNHASPFEIYALNLQHKHLPEIMLHSGLKCHPIFVPSVGNFYQGMLVQLPIHLNSLPSSTSVKAIHHTLLTHYEKIAKYNKHSSRVRVMPLSNGSTHNNSYRLDAVSLNGTDELEIYVFANEFQNQCLLVAKLDNLGKGASGAAVQNLCAMFNI